MIPGSNLLRMAQRIIRPSTVQHYVFVDRTTNEIGMLVSNFDPPVDILGSFQPVPRTLYQAMGLDFRKNYAMFYSTVFLQDVSRDRTGDQLEFGGVRWQIESSNDWHAVDGWNGILCVEVTP